MAGVCINYLIALSFFGVFFLMTLAAFSYSNYEVLHLKENHKSIALASLITAGLYLLTGILLLIYRYKKDSSRSEFQPNIRNGYQRLNEENSGRSSNNSLRNDVTIN